jgi:hypothetical protein
MDAENALIRPNVGKLDAKNNWRNVMDPFKYTNKIITEEYLKKAQKAMPQYSIPDDASPEDIARMEETQQKYQQNTHDRIDQAVNELVSQINQHMATLHDYDVLKPYFNENWTLRFELGAVTDDGYGERSYDANAVIQMISPKSTGKSYTVSGCEIYVTYNDSDEIGLIWFFSPKRREKPIAYQRSKKEGFLAAPRIMELSPEFLNMDEQDIPLFEDMTGRPRVWT